MLQGDNGYLDFISVSSESLGRAGGGIAESPPLSSKSVREDFRC